MTAHLHRRSVLALAAATFAPAAWSQAADSTLAEIKKRGTLRVGVTQAPPWYSKDPKSGDWTLPGDDGASGMIPTLRCAWL